MTEHGGVRTESATEELRRMLDECGVRWKGYGYENHTWWGEWHAENRASVNGLFVKVEALLTPAQAIEASLGAGTCKEVYLLMATDIGDGREEVLGVYATEEAAMAAINENQFGYAFHHVRKQEVVE